ncbi:MAG: RagB/SusD family nutrient uptake outer membrane protein, partial [Odoribacteraceae bacterium]|nr:RagB/SusD family nutrient uptake outer membrane protein [Odoribacteraceae bacterium]
RLKAEAHVLRAYFHYMLVNFYAKAYHPATAATDGGIPYVKEDDLLSVPSHKYTVQKVYDFVLKDLKAAFDLNGLPDRPVNTMRVGKAFAHAVEAKVRMSMHDFTGAAAAANRSLALQNTVDDHRANLAPGADPIFGTPGTFFNRPELQNSEDLFYTNSVNLVLNGITPDLKAAFEPGSIFYNRIAKANILGASMYGLSDIDVLFGANVYLNASGLTTVDMYLTLAECKIRSGDVPGAMSILNDTIRAKRVDPYTPLAAANATEAFAILKRVSRTETWFGPKNFINLKRWNTEEAYKETLRKTLLDVDYELRPDSPLWILPFPQNATGYNPNLTQNYE